ncbi:MAG: hypoxanthine phosphoribosyltransferase [Candidatus Marinimicrobia bacterium]|nr:hypoxanthine phosphoribosyltransferase [Candidatus Neomarinimicrobiota bacterium]|tara:strand:+ start:639 stop:1175 length:537 start_codon:yes stop_codon:yes gene_type:complete
MDIYDKLTLLYSAKEISLRIAEMGKELSKNFDNKEPIFIGVLNGSFIFLADLIRTVSIDCNIEFIQLKSYEGMVSSGKVEVIKMISSNLNNRHVVIVEDIIETGNTLKFLYDKITQSFPKSITTVTLLKKNMKNQLNFDIDLIGFEIPQDFVVGYGLDYNQKYRNLDGIYHLSNNNNA